MPFCDEISNHNFYLIITVQYLVVQLITLYGKGESTIYKESISYKNTKAYHEPKITFTTYLPN